MKDEAFDLAFSRMFKWFSNESSPTKLQFELDLYKKLWNVFVIGESYYFILDHHTLQVELVSKDVEKVLGYSSNEFTISFMVEKIHPDDQPWFLAMSKAVVDFFSQLPVEKIRNYKVRYDVRFKKSNGEYARILYQGILLEHDASGKFLRTLNVHTDISYLKLEGVPVLSFIGMEGEPSYLDVIDSKVLLTHKDDLTSREKQILKLMIEGRASKEISTVLNISKQTVDTHRKNMLHKKHLNNTGELVGKAIRCGWI